MSDDEVVDIDPEMLEDDALFLEDDEDDLDLGIVMDDDEEPALPLAAEEE